MDVTFADKLGTKDRQILGVSIRDGELELQLDKPDTLSWQELIYFIKYIIAEALSQESELTTGDIFQWLGAQGFVSDEVSKHAADILAEARKQRLRELMEKEKARVDTVDR